MSLDNYLKQLDEATNLDDVATVCQKFALNTGYEFFYTGIVFLSNFIQPPSRIITNIKNPTYPEKTLNRWIRESYAYSEPLIVKQHLYTLTDACRTRRYSHDGLIIPVHTTLQHYVFFSLFQKCGKNQTPAKIFDVLPQVATFARHMAQKIVNAHTPFKQQPLTLYKKERLYLGLTAAGKSYTEIADMAEVSPATISLHLKKIKHKLHAKNRSQAVTRALLQGYFRAKL